MHRIKQYLRTVSRLLIVGLLSSWLAVLRLIKYILKREVKKEDIKEIKTAPIANSGVSPLLSPPVEPKTKTIEAEGGTLALQATEAYCVKCRQKRVIQEAKKVTTQKGRRAVEGTCPVCATKLFRFIAREKENLSEEG